MKVCFVTTTPFIVNAFLRPHLLALAERHELTLATNLHGPLAVDAAVAAKVKLVHVPIARAIAPLADIRVLAGLRRLFEAQRYHVVHSVAPKAGLLAIMAAYAAGVPVRIHTFQGEVWATRRGSLRALLRACDRIVDAFATHVLVVSRGEQAFLEEEGILPRRRSQVLAAGSIAGVDLARFRPDAQARAAVRRELGIAEDALLVMYVGRLARDKGVLELARAFAGLVRRRPQARLVLVGPDEGVRRRLRGEGVHLVGFSAAPERYFAAADIVCLPSHREGFGVVLIEAGACGVPVLAARVYGIQDAVEEGVSGLLHTPGDARDLEAKLETLAADPALRARLGAAGRARVETHFRQEVLVQALLDYYSRL